MAGSIARQFPNIEDSLKLVVDNSGVHGRTPASSGFQVLLLGEDDPHHAEFKNAVSAWAGMLTTMYDFIQAASTDTQPNTWSDVVVRDFAVLYSDLNQKHSLVVEPLKPVLSKIETNVCNELEGVCSGSMEKLLKMLKETISTPDAFLRG